MDTEERESELEDRGFLMGYRGESVMDSGYFFAPYVPLTRTPVVMTSDVFVKREIDNFNFDWREEGF